MIDIIVPVLGRPRSAQPLCESIHENTILEHRVLFLCSPEDTAQIRAAMDASGEVIVVSHDPGPGDFARKTNIGISQTEGEWLLLGADDLRFEAGWETEALAVAEATGKCVIGTNDKANPEVMRGRHATHPLVARSYIEAYGTIDGEGFYHEGYDHQCVDCEATETAQARDEFAFAAGSVVRHLHPIFTRGVAMDSTYEKAMANGSRDRDLLNSRRPLWNPNYRARRRR